MDNNDLPDDAVEMVRAIWDRRYEEMKHMTREEKCAHIEARMTKNVAAFKARMANAKPDYERFPFLAPKKWKCCKRLAASPCEAQKSRTPCIVEKIV